MTKKKQLSAEAATDRNSRNAAVHVQADLSDSSSNGGDNQPIMIAARVHPKVQYGLRLLSRVQGGTIAEALEWAINLALRRTSVGTSNLYTLHALVQSAWEAGTEARRIYKVSEVAPDLLTFDERGTWNLVKRTTDLWRKASFNPSWGVEGEPELLEVESGMGDPMFDSREPVFDLIEKHWTSIKHAGQLLARAGEIDKTYKLKEIISGKAIKDAGIETDY